jgi:hypothetical protein
MTCSLKVSPMQRDRVVNPSTPDYQSWTTEVPPTKPCWQPIPVTASPLLPVFEKKKSGPALTDMRNQPHRTEPSEDATQTPSDNPDRVTGRTGFPFNYSSSAHRR